MRLTRSSLANPAAVVAHYFRETRNYVKNVMAFTQVYGQRQVRVIVEDRSDRHRIDHATIDEHPLAEFCRREKDR